MHRYLFSPLLVFLVLLKPALTLGAFVEIEIQQPPGTAFVDASTAYFGNVRLGASSSKTFRMGNAGDEPLLVSGFQFLGVSKADYAVSGLTAGNTIIAPGASRDFTVTFTPKALSVRTAILQIANTDPTENPYDILLSGVGIGPDIAVSQSGRLLVSNSGSVNFGQMHTGTTAQRPFTVQNTGSDTLNTISVSISGGSAWRSTAVTTASLAQSASFSFTVSYTPSAAGADSATLTIRSNDPDEDPFVVSLTGSGVIPGLGDLDDPDADGIPNLMEEATGTDPAIPNASPGLLQVNGTMAWFTYRRRVFPATAAILTIETADSASAFTSQWSTPAGLTETTLSSDGLVETVLATWPLPSTPSHFVRLRVSK